jgi:hypothetical protein
MPPDVCSPCRRCQRLHELPGRCADGLTSGRFHQPEISLADHLAWLESIGAKPCSCRFAWRSLSWREPGYGLHHAGYGWTRQNTDPRCPEHGAEAHAGVPAAGVVAEHPPMRRPCGCPLDADCDGYHSGALDGWPP